MRFIETQKLNDYIDSVDHILANDSLRSAYAKIESVVTASLQGFSIDGDREFLKEAQAAALPARKESGEYCCE